MEKFLATLVNLCRDEFLYIHPAFAAIAHSYPRPGSSLFQDLNLVTSSFVAVLLASINVFGGFLVVNRMLAMFKKKEK